MDLRSYRHLSSSLLIGDLQDLSWLIGAYKGSLVAHHDHRGLQWLIKAHYGSMIIYQRLTWAHSGLSAISGTYHDSGLIRAHLWVIMNGRGLTESRITLKNRCIISQIFFIAIICSSGLKALSSLEIHWAGDESIAHRSRLETIFFSAKFDSLKF